MDPLLKISFSYQIIELKKIRFLGWSEYRFKKKRKTFLSMFPGFRIGFFLDGGSSEVTRVDARLPRVREQFAVMCWDSTRWSPGSN